MHNIINIAEDLYWVGGNDRRIKLFENLFPLENGMAYNSYVILDQKTILLDGVDSAIKNQFLENISYLLQDRKLDYVIINHMEPDHCSVFFDLMILYPEIKFIGNKKTIELLRQFYRNIPLENTIVIKENDTFSTGKHNFTFYMAPMVHWPETMVTYDNYNKVIFSADAFGSFGALNGNIFHDMIDDKEQYLSEARRYYTNIVGKYGAQTLNLIKKLETLEVNMICPLHGVVWRENLTEIIDKYRLWAAYEPEENSVVVAYGSVYGNTEVIAEKIAFGLSKRGVKNIKVFDVSTTHYSYILSEIFKKSHVVLASCTYSNDLFMNMEVLLKDTIAHSMANRKFAIVENGSWAPQSGKLMKALVSIMKNTEIIGPVITVKSTGSCETECEIETLCDNIYASLSN